MPKVICAFSGCGKSNIRRELSNVSDSDSSFFTQEPAWPRNYLNHLRVNLANGLLTLMSTHTEVRDMLQKNNIDFILVYPALECKDEYIKRYIQRGSELWFVDKLEANYDDWIRDCMAQENCVHVVMRPGQYLKDVIEIRGGEFEIIREPVTSGAVA